MLREGGGELPKVSQKGVEQKRGEEKQRFLKRGASWVKLGQSVSALKGGTETPLRTMNNQRPP